MLRGFVAAAVLTFAAAALFAQTPSPTPTPEPAAATTPTPSPIAAEAPQVTPNGTPAVQKWTVVTKGSPLAKLSAQAAGGRIERLNFDVSNGTLLVSGKGLRPKVYVESVAFVDGKGITDAKFHGKGIWRPIVGIFRGIAMSALRKLQFNTDIPSVLRGEVLGSSTAKPTKETPAPTPAPAVAAAGAPTPTPG